MPGRTPLGPGDGPLVYVKMTDFTGGVISPLLEGRTDLAKYYSMCRQLTNTLPLIQGGATRRAGTVLVAVLPITNGEG